MEYAGPSETYSESVHEEPGMGRYDDEFAEEDLGKGDQALPDMPKAGQMDYGADDDDEIIEEAPSDQGAPVAVKPKNLKPPIAT